VAALRVGSEVYCTDGLAGSLAQVVLDRHTKQVSHLIVQGKQPGALYVVPMELVESWDAQSVRLRLRLEELSAERAFRAADFSSGDEVAKGTEYSQGQTLVWEKRYGEVGGSVPEVAGLVAEKIVPARIAIGRGTRVYCLDGPLGIVDHVLLKPSNGEVTHIVVRRGAFLAHAIVVPVELVHTVDETGVYIDARRETLLHLPTFSPRPDEAILAEVREWLRKVGDELRDVEISVSQGLVRLSGTVRDVRAKRLAESIARQVEGVVGVDNALTVDAAIAAQVISAPAQDPRTPLASIEVSCDRGVVTLRGSVDTAEERKAAEEIARRTPGVLLVVNEIEILPNRELPIPPYVLQYLPLTEKQR
jgi:osmotically-inducible protein OsmY